MKCRGMGCGAQATHKVLTLRDPAENEVTIIPKVPSTHQTPKVRKWRSWDVCAACRKLLRARDMAKPSKQDAEVARFWAGLSKESRLALGR